MAKNYFYIILFTICFLSFGASAQESKPQSVNQDTQIEGLSFYPNPVSNGKVYITSKLSLDKEIIIFDVLGKKVIQTYLNSKELNVSSLSPGVYIIRIKEGDATATRKLIIK
ncbi:MAG: T9SS type A sorting domain-containing protein [Bacteroidota bacterium]